MTNTMKPETRVSVSWLRNAAWPSAVAARPSSVNTDGEPEREQAGHRGDPDQVPVLAALELGDREAGDEAQVARDHRQDAGREDRHDPAAEGHEDGDVGGGDLAENHRARLRPRPRCTFRRVGRRRPVGSAPAFVSHPTVTVRTDV